MKTNIQTKIGITLGDPAGIGPEIIIKALNRFSSLEVKSLLIIGNSFVLAKCKGFDRLKKRFDMFDIDNINKRRFSFGKSGAESGKAALDYLNEALDLIKSGEIAAIVTCPVSKHSINLVKKNFYGQTEYLGHWDGARKVRMMLMAGKLKFTLATTHIPIKEVSKRLTSANIFDSIILTARDLKRLFHIKMPAIGVCGLNPHLGEEGLLGTEERKKIFPAILRAKRILTKSKVTGPYLLERVVFDLENNNLNAGICLYHDQAMFPLKLLYPTRGVNLTLGLSFLRTSPLHGTAFDIAGKNVADPSSLIDAIRLTLKLVHNAKFSSEKILRSKFSHR